MKHAYLIEAHNNPQQLIRLLELLEYIHNDIYIHIDLKSQDLYEIIKSYQTKKANIFLTDRISVSWGGFSQIKSEIILLETALRNGEYSRFHLISGADLPLKSQKDIYDFFENNQKLEFIGFAGNNDMVLNRNRIAQYHFLQEKINRGNKRLEYLENMSLEIQKKIKVDRIKNINMEIYKGSNWFSITNECAKYIVSNRSWIERHFKNTNCGDEIFIQTLVWNSKFRDNLYYDSDQKTYGNMRLIDWHRGRPYTFKEENYDELINSKYMFGRKFNESVDAKIINRICNHLKDKDMSK